MADMGKTEIDATVQELVSSVIQEQLIQNAKLMPLVQNHSAESGIDKIKIPRAGNFTVDTKAENVAVTPQVLTYATDDLNLDQYKVIQVLLEDNAQLQAKPDIVRDVLSRMGKQMALEIDTFIETLLAGVSLAAPDHKLAYANATDLKKADLLSARTLLHVQNIEFSECYVGVSPASESSLLAVDDFVHVDKYGADANGLRLGEIGKLYGAPVIMSNVFSDLKTLIWHPSHVAFAMQMSPQFETSRELEKLSNLYSISQLYGGVTQDSGLRGVWMGTAV